jgi:RimJ/RimL family protein N-acetyltransferase
VRLPVDPGEVAAAKLDLLRPSTMRGDSMATITYPLETERLLIRPNVDEDLDAVYSFQSRDDVTRYIPWYSRSREEVRQALEARKLMTDLQKDDDALVLAVTERESGALIGEIYLFLKSTEHRQGEIGYIIHPDSSGRGYATEAARAALRLGFEQFGMHRIVARCDARNEPSWRVMEKLGMRREAHLRENERFKGEWSDEIIYAMLDREWEALNRASA